MARELRAITMAESQGNEPIVSTLIQDDPSFVDLVEDFVGGLDDRIAAIKAAVDGEDFGQLKTLSHQIKGAGGGYGYPDLTEVAGRLESDSMAHDLDACKAEVDALNALIVRVIAGFKGN